MRLAADFARPRVVFGLSALRFFFVSTIAAAVAIVPFGEANAACIRQSLLNHDYCGAEASRIKGLIPERPFGDFKGACAAHDACYQFGGETIVGLMKERFQQSMLSATRAQKQEFSSEIQRTKLRCDRSFLSSMNRACERIDASMKDKCTQAASIYAFAVSTRLGTKAFDQAIDQAFTCRTR